jgi:hypothetical protein
MLWYFRKDAQRHIIYVFIKEKQKIVQNTYNNTHDDYPKAKSIFLKRNRCLMFVTHQTLSITAHPTPLVLILNSWFSLFLRINESATDTPKNSLHLCRLYRTIQHAARNKGIPHNKPAKKTACNSDAPQSIVQSVHHRSPNHKVGSTEVLSIGARRWSLRTSASLLDT